jgi:hypothetical protein
MTNSNNANLQDMLDKNNFDKDVSQSAAYNSQVIKAENIPSS